MFQNAQLFILPSDNWKVGKVFLLTGEVVKDYPIRYDIKKNIIEIKAKTEVKVLSAGRVKEINWLGDDGNLEILRNTKIYNNFNEVGFFTILDEGRKSFVKKKTLEVIEVNYVNALDIGEQERAIVKKDKYFVVDNNMIISLKKSKRHMLKLFATKANVVKQYAKNNNLSYKKNSDVIKIFDYYNSL